MRRFGNITGFKSGDCFLNRKELARSGIHPPLQAGISGSSKEGADSIVLSGGYEDDEDFGSTIIYTGSGGRDSKTGKQISHQELSASNLALAKNRLESLPIRVTRSAKHLSPYSPKSGYQYAGLYWVEDFWRETGQSGYDIWRYRLIRQENQPFSPKVSTSSQEYSVPARKHYKIKRIERDPSKARRVKQWHNYQCQVCGVEISTSAGPYAEAAHIQALGLPHSGPDIESNMLCLCPNHHVMFDNGGFTISDDYSLIKLPGKLRLANVHKIGIEFIRYHREHYQA